jgi:hypothetical protein
MGYRQGMHELASYLMFVLELEHQEYPDNPLFNPILPVCYALLERTLEQLKTAYDASGGKSLQQMSVAILGKILQNDPALYHHLTSNPNIPPPPIYCTRWVRLMFSREVIGYENVFKLWDVLFNYVNLMHALEITSASRVLLLRDALLVPDNNTLDLLMNVPPLTDITPLTDTLEKLMKQKDTDLAISLPQSTQLLSPIRSPSTPISAVNTMHQHHQHQQSQISSPVPMGQHFHHPLERSSGTGGDSKFSFTNLRQSLGQKSESLKQKIITTTNEWKDAAARRETNTGNFSSHSVDPLGGLFTHHLQNSNINSSARQTDPASHHFGVPAMHERTTMVGAAPSQPKTPKQHQHEMWSQLLQQNILTVQQFLMALESKENKGTVPKGVWEALADMDRMQRELLNYSRSMSGQPF